MEENREKVVELVAMHLLVLKEFYNTVTSGGQVRQRDKTDLTTFRTKYDKQIKKLADVLHMSLEYEYRATPRALVRARLVTKLQRARRAKELQQAQDAQRRPSQTPPSAPIAPTAVAKEDSFRRISRSLLRNAPESIRSSTNDKSPEALQEGLEFCKEEGPFLVQSFCMLQFLRKHLSPSDSGQPRSLNNDSMQRLEGFLQAVGIIEHTTKKTKRIKTPEPPRSLEDLNLTMVKFLAEFSQGLKDPLMWVVRLEVLANKTCELMTYCSDFVMKHDFVERLERTKQDFTERDSAEELRV